MERLAPQLREGVEVLMLSDGGDRSIGAKRQAILTESTADYICFVDDDDLVAADYVAKVRAVIDAPNPPDVVGFRLRHYVDGRLAGLGVHSYDAATTPVAGLNVNLRRYDRLPNHLNPVRRDIALKVGYQDRDVGEDGEFARGLRKLKPREHFLDWYAYDYLFRTKRPGERTHSDRVAR